MLSLDQYMYWTIPMRVHHPSSSQCCIIYTEKNDQTNVLPHVLVTCLGDLIIFFLNDKDEIIWLSNLLILSKHYDEEVEDTRRAIQIIPEIFSCTLKNLTS